jgi:hypothetical protein
MKNLDATALSSSAVNTPRARRASLGVVLLGAALSVGCGESGTSLQAPSLEGMTQALSSTPATCQELRSANPSAVDGEYTLYVGGDVKRPWAAYCHDMAGSPREYLTLVNTGSGANFSQYTAGDASPGQDVRTSYSKLRIDPVTLRVHVADQTFAQSSGALNHGSELVTSMPYGVAMSCDTQASGLANLDLRGTSFAVAASAFSLGGAAPTGETRSSVDRRVVDLTGGGYCGWNSWAPAYNPFNQNGGTELQLEYRDARLPDECADFRNDNPAAGDGEYTLFFEHDPARPWTAYCFDMAGTPREYLPLQITGSSANFSQYTAGGATSGQSVRTWYSKLRIDPVTLRVHVADQTFAQSTGLLRHGTETITAMPYGVAMSCNSQASGLANLDLNGTAFAVAANQFFRGGAAATGVTSYSADRRVVSLSGGGYCGWNSWAPAYNPFNQNGATQLRLEYRALPASATP